MSEETTWEEVMARRQDEQRAAAAEILQEKLRARALQPIEARPPVTVNRAGEWG